ncbi:hypothetical protein AVEN_249963-1 [Araneus ventricosus]|uniref:Uncharacterized protein n=1 Tax=Araneus ventricosus TaxID=182803 RepID=A0A4Y2KLZ5_ARAVE|nr:hypothetical protein AVEN_249963-1 [Araneus ventricosus]
MQACSCPLFLQQLIRDGVGAAQGVEGSKAKGDLGRCDLLVRSRLRDGRIQSLNPITPKNRSVSLVHAKSAVKSQTTSRCCDSKVWRGGAGSGVVVLI